MKWWKIKEKKDSFSSRLNEFTVNTDQAGEAMWKEVTGQVHAATTEVLGKAKQGKTFIDKLSWWWNEKVQLPTRTKKQTFKTWCQTRLRKDIDPI